MTETLEGPSAEATFSNPSGESRWSAFSRYLPAAAFLAFLLYYWRIYDITARITGYGDALEYVWAIEWFVEGLKSGAGVRLFIPHVFMPEGWSLGTFANGLGVFVLAVPIALVSTSAAALNALVLLFFFIAYWGTYRLVRLVAGSGVATVMALIYLLWGGRWLRVAGHFHILLGSAILPLILLSLERALKDRHRWWLWIMAAGLLWAIAISFSLYFIWICLFLVAGWLFVAAAHRRVTALRAVAFIILTGVIALLFSAPYFYLYLRAREGIVGFDIQQVNVYNLSLDWLPALFPHHPIAALADLALRQTDGAPNEAAFSGFGILLVLLAGLGLMARSRQKEIWAAALLTAVIGITLALGPTLFWNGQPVSWPALQPMNEAIWDLGHRLKPDIFPGQDAPPAFATAVPLPGLLLSVLVPFFEGARVSARYLLLAAPGVLMLAAMALENQPRRWLVGVVALLLLIEAARYPILGQQFPVPPHAAFTWLSDHPVSPGESVFDIYQPFPDMLVPILSGDILWPTTLHHQPIIGGGGSVLPVPFDYLLNWFIQHPNPSAGSELPWLLRGYGVRYLALHYRGEHGAELDSLFQGTNDIIPVDCFDGVPGSPWKYPICIMELIPPPNPALNVFPAHNFSAPEEWGMWAMDDSARISWYSTRREDARFLIEAFPYCVDDVGQEIEIIVNEKVLGSHKWDSCDPWQTEIVIASDDVEIGRNNIWLNFAESTRPIDHTNGQNPDTRPLSVGFTRFERLP